MNSIFVFLVKLMMTIPIMFITWLVLFIGYDQTFLASSGIAVGGGVILFGLLSGMLHSRYLKKNGLTRKEFNYIKKNLQEAKKKIARLQRSVISIRHITTLKQRIDLLRVVRKIYSLSKAEPKRFYKAERFFYSHLDSALELTEKYVFLSSQPKKTLEVQAALVDTRTTLDELIESIEKDLYYMLSNDIEQLHFELDVAKHSIGQIKNSQSLEEVGKHDTK
ncbi:5-bromo-4-chloroindolyl phosphate hydrolysis family protein [Bacillus salitolerans]|uniref:5-bromo-4-chloroindolyl phosphate hydrolysis family protein n=1 Tax=Bacillus salitolerans TaxID=1437434 RepID=A0ABW4LY59_9BACI